MAMKGWVDLGRTQVRLSALCEIGRIIETSNYYKEGQRTWYTFIGHEVEQTSTLDFDEFCRRIAEAEGEAKPVDTRTEPDGRVVVPQAIPSKETLADMSMNSLFRMFASVFPYSDSSPSGDARLQRIVAVADERIARAFDQGKAAAKPEPQKMKVRVSWHSPRWRWELVVRGELATIDDAKADARRCLAALGLEAEFEDET